MKSRLKPKLTEAFNSGKRLSKYDVAAMFHCTERWANDLLKAQPGIYPVDWIRSQGHPVAIYASVGRRAPKPKPLQNSYRQNPHNREIENFKKRMKRMKPVELNLAKIAGL